MYQDRFKTLTDEEKKEQAEQQQKIIEAQRKVVDAGKKCLATDDFRRYREAYQRLEALAIDSLIEYSNPDTNKYAFFVSAVLNKLGVYKSFIDLVEKDSRKVLPERKEESQDA